MEKKFLRQLGIGVASLTFGVALLIFIITAASGRVNSQSAWLLFATSFLLMLRYWWRYTELFIKSTPSQSYWEFLSDFAISFFGILAVWYVSEIQIWAMLGAAAMVTSIIRCNLSWRHAEDESVKGSLKKTVVGSFAMLIVMSLVCLLSSFIIDVKVAAGALIIVLVFVVYSSVKK